jgi:hypothetical protein
MGVRVHESSMVGSSQVKKKKVCYIPMTSRAVEVGNETWLKDGIGGEGSE